MRLQGLLQAGSWKVTRPLTLPLKSESDSLVLILRSKCVTHSIGPREQEVASPAAPGRSTNDNMRIGLIKRLYSFYYDV